MIYLLIIVSAISLYLSFRYLKRAHILENIPTAKIRSAPQGYIELIGKAKPITTIPYYVPETNIPCVWFECKYRHGYDEGGRSIVECKSTKQSFLVDDDTGTCRIDPFKIKTITKLSKKRSLKDFILDQITYPKPGMLSVRWISIGEEIHVYGKVATLHVDYSIQRKDLIKSRMKALKADRELMMQFDTNKDGVIDVKEWDTARERINKEVDEYILDKQKHHKDAVSEHVIRPSDDPKLPYLVSCHKELKIIRRYKLYSLGFFILFLLFGITIADNYHYLSWFTKKFI